MEKEEWKSREDEDEDVSSYCINSCKREDTENWKRKHWIPRCGDLALQDAMNLSHGRLQNEWGTLCHAMPTGVSKMHTASYCSFCAKNRPTHIEVFWGVTLCVARTVLAFSKGGGAVIFWVRQPCTAKSRGLLTLAAVSADHTFAGRAHFHYLQFMTCEGFLFVTHMPASALQVQCLPAARHGRNACNKDRLPWPSGLGTLCLAQ
jgi:hypothetical protein